MSTAHFFVILAICPGYKGLNRAVQAHGHGEDQDIEEHVTKADTS